MQTLNQFQELFNEYLENNRFDMQPASLYEPVNYIMQLGGKRLRPSILMMAYSLFDEHVEKALPAAFAVEVFHNFTLLHDDIMDDAPLRRGAPTVHEKYDINTGILSGDVMQVQAYRHLLKSEPISRIPEVMEIFTRTAIEICEGQQMDMDFEKKDVVAIGEYLRMIELKTAVLLAAAMKIGARLAGSDRKDADHLYDFARNLGIAFQLQDDLLDAYGDPVSFGKKVGGDIVNNKKTFLYLKALELGSESQRKVLKGLFSTTPEDEAGKIRKTLEIFEDLGVRMHTEQLQMEYQSAAFHSLDAVQVAPGRKKGIESFAKALMKRKV